MLSQNLTETGSLVRFVELLCANLPATTVWEMAAEATTSNPYSDESQALMEAMSAVVSTYDGMARPQSEQATFEQWLDELARD